MYIYIYISVCTTTNTPVGNYRPGAGDGTACGDACMLIFTKTPFTWTEIQWRFRVRVSLCRPFMRISTPINDIAPSPLFVDFVVAAVRVSPVPLKTVSNENTRAYTFGFLRSKGSTCPLRIDNGCNRKGKNKINTPEKEISVKAINRWVFARYRNKCLATSSLPLPLPLPLVWRLPREIIIIIPGHIWWIKKRSNRNRAEFLSESIPCTLPCENIYSSYLHTRQHLAWYVFDMYLET